MSERLRRMTQFTHKYRTRILAIFLGFCVVLLGVISGMLLKNFSDTQRILEEAVNYRLIAMATLAREALDVSIIKDINSAEDALSHPQYEAQLAYLRALCDEIQAKYLYVIKQIDGKYYFVYDTDPEIDVRFYEYMSITELHKSAFLGSAVVEAFNVDDDFGSFSSGVIPIIKDGEVIAVVGADLEDELLEKNRSIQTDNMIFLFSVIAFTMLVMAVWLFLLLKKIKEMSDRLYRQAHYDKLTALPNRQYLLEHLEKITTKGGKGDFSLFFVDLDNFKMVNDIAGHDAGDALLRNIGSYLAGSHADTKVFRPQAGQLNVAARIGGDEFILVAPYLTEAEAKAFGNELIHGLKQKVADKNIDRFNVGFSIGISRFPSDSENMHVLIKYADIAMYHAKRAGKNQCLLYDVEMKGKEEK